MRRAFLLACFALLAGCASIADEPAPRDALSWLPALAGENFTIHSRETGREYRVFVRLPEGYDAKSAARYPVVYLLDGDILFPLLASTHLLLHYDEKVPEAIIVGIAYGAFGEGNFRSTDYTIQLPGSPPEHGGAAAFLRFIEKELLPRVEARHAVDSSRRVLLGQSLGGNFVLWSAQQAPDLFWARIASNPGAAVGLQAFSSTSRRAQRGDLHVILATGSRDTRARREAASAWARAWAAKSAPWQLTLMPVEGGTHAATIGEIYRRALLQLFQKEGDVPSQ